LFSVVVAALVGVSWLGYLFKTNQGKSQKNCRQPASDERLRGMVFVQRDVEPTRVLATAMAGGEARQSNSEIFILTGNVATNKTGVGQPLF
jgi:hypothetical protein